MKSNDKIPKDEMLLAKMIQNTKARGMKAHRGSYYLTPDGYKYSLTTTTLDSAIGCCAVGACWLESDTEAISDEFGDLITGNDSTADTWSAFASDEGETVGYAFQQACK